MDRRRLLQARSKNRIAEAVVHTYTQEWLYNGKPCYEGQVLKRVHGLGRTELKEADRTIGKETPGITSIARSAWGRERSFIERWCSLSSLLEHRNLVDGHVQRSGDAVDGAARRPNTQFLRHSGCTAVIVCGVRPSLAAKQHKLSKKKPGHHYCKQCNKEFTNPQDLKRHRSASTSCGVYANVLRDIFVKTVRVVHTGHPPVEKQQLQLNKERSTLIKGWLGANAGTATRRNTADRIFANGWANQRLTPQQIRNIERSLRKVVCVDGKATSKNDVAAHRRGKISTSATAAVISSLSLYGGIGLVMLGEDRTTGAQFSVVKLHDSNTVYLFPNWQFSDMYNSVGGRHDANHSTADAGTADDPLTVFGQITEDKRRRLLCNMHADLTDPNVLFRNKGHIYWRKTKDGAWDSTWMISVTTLVKLYQGKKPFCAPAVAKSVKEKSGPESPYHTMTTKAIRKTWQKSKEMGTYMHLNLHRYLNGVPVCDDYVRSDPHVWQQCLAFVEDFQKEFNVLRTELSVCDRHRRLAGTIDIVAERKYMPAVSLGQSKASTHCNSAGALLKSQKSQSEADESTDGESTDDDYEDNLPIDVLFKLRSKKLRPTAFTQAQEVRLCCSI